MNIPQRIRIGAVDYTITTVPSAATELEPHFCGRIDEANQNITLLSSGQQAMECYFLHEIIHGLLYTAGYPVAEHDEKLIDALAHGLQMLVRDNPELFEPRDGGEEDGEKKQEQGQG